MKGNLRRLLAIFLVLMLLSADVCAIAEAVVTLTLPSSLQIIEEEAFAGNTSIEKVIVPDGTTEIRSRAFADSSMTELELPDSLTFIAEDAFEGCGEFALTVPENCYAYDRCVELGLIKSDEPDPSVIESVHPYPDEFDYTWTYDAGEGTESVTITFSADTETEEDYDFIYIYTLDDVQVGAYSGTELAGQSVTIDGTGFKLRLTSDEAWDGGNTYYGFKLDSIVPKKAVPLTFESIAAESNAVNAGEMIRWTVATTGGKAPVYYDYTVLLGEEEVATGTVEAPNAIEYTPVRAGEYKLSVIARDSADVVLPAQVSDAVTVAPSTAYPESAHPYAANTDQSWVYAAEENVESLTVTFSEETKTQSNYDYIYIYDQTGTQFGKYSGTQLAGQTIEIMGSAFTIRLTSNGSTQYNGFTITNIEKYIPGPLTFVSLTVDKSKAKTGDLITWTMETEGGRRPVTYEYTVTLNGETKYTGSVIRPEQITYVPMTAGDYTMSVVAKDAEGNELPAQTSKVRITERGETAAEYFTVVKTSGNFAKITGYIGEDIAVVIPSVIGEYTIDEIAANAFQDNQNIVSVVIPDTTRKIGIQAFAGCKELRSVYIADSVYYIGEKAFYNCYRLNSVNYPMNWTSVSNSSSNNCIFSNTDIETITVPDGVTAIPRYAFDECTSLKNIIFADSIDSIGRYAFAGCTSLEKVYLPENVVKIEEGVFRNCSSLQEIKLSDRLTSLGRFSFENCTALEFILLPETLAYINRGAFKGCTLLSNIYIPNGVRGIEAEAFRNCSSLSEINYPVNWEASVSYYEIGNIFTGTAIETIEIPEGVTSIPNHAFRNCANFVSFHLPSTMEEIGEYAFAGCDGLASISIPNGTKVIEEKAFYNCERLSSVTLPDSINHIGEAAFSYCPQLSVINYPLGWNSTSGGDIFIGTSIQEVTIPEGVTQIPDYAFENCDSLKKVILPSSLTDIGEHSFGYCSELSGIDIPSNIKKIGRGAFIGCKSLVSITLPEGTIDIDSYAFKYCYDLINVDLPHSLQNIGYQAFAYCESLTTLYIPDSVSFIDAQAFLACRNLSNVNYPLGWKTTGKTGDVFAGTALDTLVIPEGVTHIPAYAFYSCTNFTHFELPDSLQSIPAYAFAGCTNLEKIWIPEGIEPQYDEEGNQTSFVPIASTAFNDVSTSTMSIHGVSGSYAETFAKSKGYPFVAEAFEYTPATLSGIVTDAAGNPLSGVTVTVYKGPTTNYPFGSTTTDSTGAWSMENVKVGSYYGVGFEKEGYAFTPSLVAITIVDGTNQLNDVVGYTAETTAYLNLSDYEWISASDASLRVIQIDSSEDWSIAECSDWIDMYVADVGEDVSAVSVDTVQTYARARTSTQKSRQYYKRGTPLMLLLGYNDSAETRTGSITINSAGLSKTINVYQQAFDNAFGPQISITNPTGDGETVYRVGDALHIVLSGKNFGIGEVVILDGAGKVTRYTFAKNEAEIVHTLSAAGMCTITVGVVSVDSFDSNGHDYDAAQTVSIVVEGNSDSIGGMKVSDQFIAYIEEREGRHYTMYKDSANKETIGIGHLISDDELEAETFKDRTLTDAEVEALFRSDIAEAENIVNQYAVDKRFSFSQNQFDALVSFSFNLGDRFYSKNKDGSKTKLNEWLGSAGPNIEDWKVFNAFARWHHSEVNGVLVDTAGLYYRRMEEATMFTQGIYDVRYDWPLPDWFKDKAVGVDVPDDWYSSGIATLRTGATQVSAGAAGGIRSVNVFASGNWTATTSDGWIALTTASGNGNGTLKFSVDAYTEQLARTGHIQITMGNLSCAVEVIQTGTAGEMLLVYASADSVSVRPGETVKFTASATGGSGNYSYTLLVYKNGTIIYESPAQASNILEYIPLLDGDYNYKVRVKDGTSKSTISALGAFKAVCDPITGLTSLVDGAVYGADGLKQMNIDWDPAIGATSYQIRVRNLKTGEMFISNENSDKGYEVADSSVKFDQYTWPDASWFRLWIGAFDANGAKVAQTQRVFSTYTLPEVVMTAPTSIEIKTAEDVSISWNEVDKAAWYLLSVRNTNTNESLRNSKRIDKAVKSDVLSASDLIAGNEYNIWIAAYSEDGARIAEKIFKFTYSPEGTEVETPVTGTTIKIRGVDMLYAPGEYFTKNGKACTKYAEGGCHNAKDILGYGICGVADDCNCIHEFRLSRGYVEGGINPDLGDGQCKGFALYCQVMMYGARESWNDGGYSTWIGKTDENGFMNYGGWKKNGSTADLKKLIQSAGVGAHIRAYTKSYLHSLIVTSISDEGFTIVQVNGENNHYTGYYRCRIGTYYYTWEEYANSKYGKYGIMYVSNSNGNVSVAKDYSTPLVGYTLSSDTVKTYTNLSSVNSSGWINSSDGTLDVCTLSYLYSNGRAYATYPTSNNKTTDKFVDLSAFIDTSFSKYNASVVSNTATYRQANLEAEFGYVSSGTAVTVVGKSGNSTQIIYASGNKYYLAWVPSSSVK